MASMRLVPLALAAALLLAPAAARADGPGAGTPLLVGGSVLAAGGAITLGASALCPGASIPLAPAGAQPSGLVIGVVTYVITPQSIAAHNACAMGTAAGGGIAMALSIPLLVLGAGQRLEWLTKLRPTVAPQGAALSWSATF